MLFQLWNRPLAATSRAARTRERLGDDLIDKLDRLHDGVLRTGVVTESDLRMAYRKSLAQEQRNHLNPWYAIGILLFIMLATPMFFGTIHFILGVRCFLPNNYLVWEATRPISDCGFCSSVQGPLILQNLTREEFAPFAYSSQPIIIKNAVAHWPAAKSLNFTYLKDLYERTPGALDEDCQFLHFRSDFKSLKDVFLMSDQRAKFAAGNRPWYVGWSNCHPTVLEELRKLYPRPHFLPEDAEMPNTDYIFLGYEQGAFMHANKLAYTMIISAMGNHLKLSDCFFIVLFFFVRLCFLASYDNVVEILDYIPRLMWQAQLQGNKSWILAPTPECDHLCHSFSFYVEPGDAVLVDTRIWYHGTSIPKGQFALTIQSEYG